MELNREQIIKALEYFIEDECCVRTVVHDALALIKELTDENERLRADTVREMEHKIWLEFSDCLDEELAKVESFRASVSEIVKEMVEG